VWDTIVSPYVVPRVIVYLLVLYRLTTVTSDTTRRSESGLNKQAYSTTTYHIKGGEANPKSS